MVTLNPIGTVSGRDDGTASVILERRFAPALAGLADFSHVIIVWWADRTAGPEREELVQPAPYRGGPDRLGMFATLAPTAGSAPPADPPKRAGQAEDSLA